MANPQKEHGFTPIANELLEAIYSAKFNSTQLKIALFILRYTYGFSRKEHKLSLNFISRGIGVSRRYVSHELKTLINADVVTVVSKHTDTEARVLSLNKNYESWTLGRSKLQQVKNSSTGEELDNTTGEELFNTTGEELFHQDKKNIKKNIKKVADLFSSDSNPYRAALYLRNKIAANHPRQPLPPDDPNSSKAQSWAQTMDLLNRLGPPGGSRGYGWPEIRRLIDFATSDPFWQNNILSAQKFRAQIVKLEAKAKQEAGKEAGRGCHSPEHKRLGGASR